MKREIAVFINMPAAERAGQAAVQETNDRFRIVRKYMRGQVLGYAVRLYEKAKSPNDKEFPRYIME